MNGRVRIPADEQERRMAAPSVSGPNPSPSALPLSDARRHVAQRGVERHEIAGFGAAPPGWADQFGPAPRPNDPTVDDLKRAQAERLRLDPGGPKFTGIELAQRWARDLEAFRHAERKRFRIDTLVAAVLDELPAELWLPSPAAMARSRYSAAEAQTLESPHQVDPTPLRSKLYLQLAALRGEKIDPLAPLGPIWHEASQEFLAVEINAEPLTEDEALILWFLFPSEMLEWARREVAVQESVARERERRGALVASGAASGALQMIAVGSIPTMAAGLVLAAPAAGAAYTGLSTGASSLGWSMTSTALRAAPNVTGWALQNPVYALGLGLTGVSVAQDVVSGEFSLWNLPFYFGDVMTARGGGRPQGGGAGKARASKAPFSFLPQPLKNAIMATQIGLAETPALRGTSGATLGVPEVPVPGMVMRQSPGQAVQAPTPALDPAAMPTASAPIATSARVTATPEAVPLSPSRAEAAPSIAAPAPGAAVASPRPDQLRPDAARVAGPGAQRDLGMSADQHDAIRQGLGQRLTDGAAAPLGAIWNAVANPGERATLTLGNARRLFSNQRRRFWAAVRRDQTAREFLTRMGWDGGGSPTSAPVIVLPNGARMRLTIDHIVERQTDPSQALDAGNLRLSSTRENTVVLRLLHLLDPFVNPPAGTAPPPAGIQIDDPDLDRLDD